MDQFLTFILNHWALASAFGVVVAALLFMELRGQMSGVRQLSPQQTTDLINRENALIIDIRSSEDFSRGHIAGSKHLPLSSLTEESALLADSRKRSVVVVCNRGRSALAAAAQLQKMGFTQVSCLQGGLSAWREGGLPLIKE